MHHRQHCLDQDVSLGRELVEPSDALNIHIQMQNPVTHKHCRKLTHAPSDNVTQQQ